MILVFRLEQPYRWAIVDRTGKVTDKGMVDDLAAMSVPKNTNHVVAVVPGSDVTIRKLTLPARTRAKALAAIPYALEDSLATDVEELFFALLDWQPGESAVVAIVARTKMAQWMESVERLPTAVDTLLPEYFLLPIHAQTEGTIARYDDDTLYIRTGVYEGLSIEDYALELWWNEFGNKDLAIACTDAQISRKLIELGASMVRSWDIGPDFTKWLKYHDNLDISANLLQGYYQPAHQREKFGNYKIAALVLLAALVVKIVVDGFEYVSLVEKDRSLDAQINTTFREAFPSVKRVVNPRLQMEQRVKQLKSGFVGEGEFQLLLSAVARAIPASDAKVDEISFRENSMIVTCTTRDFAGLDRLKTQFAQDPRVRAELLSSGARDNRVSGRFRIDRAQG